MKKLLVSKRCVIRIPRDNEGLCYARGIVTNRAKAENDPQWQTFQRNRRLQRHEAASVPPGECGPTELRAFATLPSMMEYTLVVVDPHRAYTTFCVWPRRYFTRSVVLRPLLRRLDLLTRVLWQILLLRLQQTRPPSMPRECQPLPRMFPFGMCQSSKANETSHRCPSSIKCPDCHRLFHGHQCLNDHQRFTLMGQTATQDKLFVCQTYKKCPQCFKLS